MALQIDALDSGTTRTISFNPLQDWTRAFWVYVPDPGADYHTFCQVTNVGNTRNFSSFAYLSTPSDPLPSTNVQDLEFTNGAESEYFQSAINYAEWYYFTIRYTASTRTLDLFNNAVLAATFTLTSANLNSMLFAATDTEYLGTDMSGAGSTGLAIAYDRVWQRALSAAELFREMNAPEAITSLNLVSDTPLVDDLIDISGNEYDWTAVGTTSFVVGPSLPPFVKKQWRIYRFDLKPREEEKA